MADYHSPTVVTPTIPLADITPLERLILEAVFDTELDRDDEHIYLFSEIGSSDLITVDRDDLLGAFEASVTVSGSTATERGAKLLREESPDTEAADIDIDMSDTSWEFILQDIVKRSPTLDEIVVTTSFTCTKMRPDGFGGAVTLITADTISGKSTTDMLDDLRSDAEDNGETVANPNAAAPSPKLLETALCVWEAMLDLRADHDVKFATKPGTRAMMTVWEELGSVAMR